MSEDMPEFQLHLPVQGLPSEGVPEVPLLEPQQGLPQRMPVTYIQDMLPLACGICGFPLGTCLGHTFLDIGEDWCKFCKEWCMIDSPPGCPEYVTCYGGV